MSSYDDHLMHIMQGSHNAYHANCRGRGQAELDWRNVDTVLLWGINVQASLKVVFGLRIIFLQDFKSGLNSFCCLSINLFLQMTVEQVKRLSLVNSTITHLPHQGFHLFLFLFLRYIWNDSQVSKCLTQQGWRFATTHFSTSSQLLLTLSMSTT